MNPYTVAGNFLSLLALFGTVFWINEVFAVWVVTQ